MASPRATRDDPPPVKPRPSLLPRHVPAFRCHRADHALDEHVLRVSESRDNRRFMARASVQLCTAAPACRRDGLERSQCAALPVSAIVLLCRQVGDVRRPGRADACVGQAATYSGRETSKDPVRRLCSHSSTGTVKPARKRQFIAGRRPATPRSSASAVAAIPRMFKTAQTLDAVVRYARRAFQLCSSARKY